MKQKNKLLGQRFGRWIVTAETKERKNGSIYWLCKCDCGTERLVNGSSLKSQQSKSCGCLRDEIAKTINIGRKSEKLDDLTDRRFGRWRVLAKDKNKNGHTRWLCKCDCGTIKEVYGHSLKRKGGGSKSCGCYEKDHPSALRHGGRKSRLYSTWCQIKVRCYNPNWRAYHRYGGRGITMCQEWKDDFLAFQKWANENGYKSGLTIDRINNDGNYEPSNCQWITASENVSRSRKNQNKILGGG